VYIASIDFDVIRSREVQDMLDRYEEKFDQRFIPFSYADFRREGDKCAGQVYKEALEKALQDDKPSPLRHELTFIELQNIEYLERQQEIKETIERGDPLQLTGLELLNVECKELRRIYEETFGMKLKLPYMTLRLSRIRPKHPELAFLVREALLEALREGKPYQAEPLEEAIAWEDALVEKLKRKGKWPPQVPEEQVWDREGILSWLRREIAEG